MKGLWRVLGLLGFREEEQVEQPSLAYRQAMEEALNRIEMAKLQIREATTIEELDIARSNLLSGHADIQQLIRTAKRDRGIALRPISETEEIHRNLKEFMFGRADRNSARRKTGTKG